MEMVTDNFCERTKILSNQKKLKEIITLLTDEAIYVY